MGEKERLVQNNKALIDRGWRRLFVNTATFMFGVQSLLSWGLFITAEKYFRQKFSFSSTIDRDFEVYFEVCGVIFSTATGFMTMWVINKVDKGKVVFICALSTTVTLFLTAWLARVDTSDFGNHFFLITMFVFCTLSGISGIYSCIVLSDVSTLHPSTMKFFMLGQGSSVILTSLMYVFYMSLEGTDNVTAFYYFSSGAVLTILVYLMYWGYLWVSNTSYQILDEEEEGGMFSLITIPFFWRFGESASSSDKTEEESDKRVVMGHIWGHCVILSFTFLITFSLAPGILSRLTTNETKTSLLSEKYFIIIVFFLNFSVSDLIGRFLGGYVMLRSHVLSVVLIFARIILAVCLAMCNIQPRNHDLIPVAFTSDAISIVLIFLFGASHGFITSSVCRQAPGEITNKADKEQIGAVLSVVMMGGTLLGVLAALCIAQLY